VGTFEKLHETSINCVQWSSRFPRKLVTSSDDHTALIVELDAETNVSSSAKFKLGATTKLIGHTESVNCATFGGGDEDEIVATASNDMSIIPSLN